MIEKHDTNSFLFRETEEVKVKERGTENYRFYNRFLEKQLNKIMKKKTYEVEEDEARFKRFN